MGYSDPKYFTRMPFTAASHATFGTATASSATGHDLSAVCHLPKFLRKTVINDGVLVVTTIPNAASTALKASFLNGTNTFGTAILTTATAGQKVDITITSTANAVFEADVAPTISLTGTATASGAANGSYTVLFEIQEKFA